MSQPSIGERLRQAREAIPASLTEASRATRVRVDFLEAMERDSFTFISGRVYVVGMLRSYARWLRLNENEIAAEFDRIYGAPEAATESLAPRGEPRMPVVKPRKPHWALIGAVALGVLVVLGIASLLGNNNHVANPLPVTLPPSPTPTQTEVASSTVAPSVELTVSAAGRSSSQVYVVAGNTIPSLILFDGTLGQGVTRTFTAGDLLQVQITNLGAVNVSVNGKNLGTQGAAGQKGSYSVGPDGTLAPDPAFVPLGAPAPPPRTVKPPSSPSVAPSPSVASSPSPFVAPSPSASHPVSGTAQP